MASSRNFPTGAIGLLFVLGFSVPGICLWIAGLKHCWKVYEMDSWIQVEGIVYDQRRKGSSGQVDYEYLYQGTDYRRSENLSEDERVTKIGKRVGGAVEGGQPAQIWIDPEKPSQAELIRKEVDAMPLFFGIFTLSHGALGLGILAGWLWMRGPEKRGEILRDQYPDEPWRWRDDWDDQRVETRPYPHWPLLFAAVAWNSLAWATAFLAFFLGGNRGLQLGAIGAILFGALIAWLWGRQFRRVITSKKYQLGIPSGGLSLGQSYDLPIHVPADKRDSLRVKVGRFGPEWQLSRVRPHENKSDDSEVISDGRTEFEKPAELTTLSGSGSAAVRVSFPEKGPLCSGDQATEEGIRWELKGKTKEGVRLGPYCLPVFHKASTNRKSASSKAESELNEDDWSLADDVPPDFESRAEILKQEHIEVERIDDGYRFHLTMRRQIVGLLVGIVLGSVFAAVGLFVLFSSWGTEQRDDFPALLFGGIFATVGILVGTSSLIYLFGRQSIEVTSHAATSIHRFPIWTRRRTIPRHEIIEAKLRSDHESTWQNLQIRKAGTFTRSVQIHHLRKANVAETALVMVREVLEQDPSR